VIAPFDYTAMIWSLIIGYFVFGDMPYPIVLVGASIVIGAGLFVIWRERQLGIQRARQRQASPPPV
jgi:drug/metabolite transporter (DMT)-like permease